MEVTTDLNDRRLCMITLPHRLFEVEGLRQIRFSAPAAEADYPMKLDKESKIDVRTSPFTNCKKKLQSRNLHIVLEGHSDQGFGQGTFLLIFDSFR